MRDHVLSAAVLGVSAFAASFASAGGNTILYTITASNANGSASLNIFSDNPNLVVDDTGSLTWSLASVREFRDAGGNLIATLDAANLGQQFFTANIGTDTAPRGPGQPAASLALDFAVTAGGLDTVFTISSTVLLPGTFIIPVYEATAAVTVTDTTPVGGSATLTGNGQFAPNAYNFGFDAIGFAGLVGTPLTTATSTTGSQGAGPANVGNSINSLFANFSFVLSANDLASGTSFLSVVDVVPSPASVALLGLGGLVATRRRR